MAGCAFVGSHSCVGLHLDHGFSQLQLLLPLEPTAASSQQKNRNGFSGKSVSCMAARPFMDCTTEASYWMPKDRPCDRASVVCTAVDAYGNTGDALFSHQLNFMPHRLHRPRIFVVCIAKPLLDGISLREGTCFRKKSSCLLLQKNDSWKSVICAAKPILDHPTDRSDSFVSEKLNWREEVLSALQRSLLESQWALQSAQSSTSGKGSFDSESTNSSFVLKPANAIVRSGQPSARQRRLNHRLRGNAMNSCNDTMDSTVPSKFQIKKRKGKAKLEPLQDFVSSFLRPTAGHRMFTKEQEQGFTRQMRICQSLEKAKRKLKKKLGYEPSCELWAHSVQMSTGELLSMVSKGEVARSIVLLSHLRLVVSVAKNYQNLGVDVADLIQEGSKGLLRGLEKFDHRKGYKISTYVHWWIRQGVTRAIADRSRMMRVPVYLHEVMCAINKGRFLLAQEGRPVTVENLSSMLNIPSYKIERALRAKTRIKSLDRSDDSDGLKMEFNSLHEFVADQNSENQPWDVLIEEETKSNIRNRLLSLTPKEQEIIRWAFGVGTEGGAQSTLTSLGQKFGVSKERVRQIKFCALYKMREMEDRVDIC